MLSTPPLHLFCRFPRLCFTPLSSFEVRDSYFIFSLPSSLVARLNCFLLAGSKVTSTVLSYLAFSLHSVSASRIWSRHPSQSSLRETLPYRLVA
ncbi:hypothetical protein ASPWEDRAFT_646660 [Aspergillus wentii DTO 134E9]|uniref:Uncharacterized protein n=1 Tax=Aspergillus wentii DTO 134E9 TaxID=1073089 RepID=A0A1L9RAZ4_ASPWE|nr:uncharacterized protein ASPWEDRAFT_646660 [Aspergillus wentii DTO 134E9]OJJ32027.1 hypothetical protein ASPWEDRAFT_646660 [Aspergillus wentii DTO 134E9]